MIAIVDYGAGNLVSVEKALDWLGEECEITSDPGQVAKASKIVLPGVGHFASTAALGRSGLQDAIADAIGRGIPFLGIPGDAWAGPVGRRMRALSCKREIAACGMEPA